MADHTETAEPFIGPAGRLLGRAPERGPYADDDTPIETAFATVHPAAVLRSDDRGGRVHEAGA